MGNAHQLTRAGATPGRPAGRTWGRTTLYAAGTVSMLVISMVCSLSLWIALPWAFLGWSPTLVVSGSMAPLVTPGDVVMIRPVSREELGANTVVLFERPGSGRVLHRIVEQLPDGTFRTQGDANASPDSEILREEDVHGTAVLAVPWIGRPSLWLSQGRAVPVAATGIGLVVLLGLAPRAFDPSFDPWAAGRRVAPAEVLLGRAAGDPEDRRAAGNRRLLPVTLHQLVLDRLAAQSAAAQSRTAHLLEGLS